MNPIIMHINFAELRYDTYGKRTIDDVCKLAAELGYDGVEFRGKPPVEFKEMPFADYIKQIAAAKQKYGLSEILFGIQVSDTLSEDAAVRAATVAETVQKAKLANELCGTTVCNTFGQLIKSPIPTAPAGAYEFTGSGAATQEQWKLTVDAFQQIGKGLEPVGVRFAFETHMNYIHDLPAATRKLVDMIDSPNIGINMDYGNTVYFPTRPGVEETIELYGEKLFYTHLKNSVAMPGKRFPTALGEGEINHWIYLEKLREIGFTGPIGIEAPRPGDRIWYAQKDLEYCKAVIASI